MPWPNRGSDKSDIAPKTHVSQKALINKASDTVTRVTSHARAFMCERDIPNHPPYKSIHPSGDVNFVTVSLPLFIKQISETLKIASMSQMSLVWKQVAYE